MTAHAIRLRYQTSPLATCAVMFAILAVVRIAGAFSVPLVVVSVVLTPLVVAAVPPSMRRDVGLRKLSSARGLVSTVALVVLVYAATAAACAVAFGGGDDNWITWIPRVFEELTPGAPVATAIAMLICLGILVPVAEEVCYRGVLQHTLQRRFGPAAAVILTAAAWAFVHMGDYGLKPLNSLVLAGMLPSVFLMGVALGVCRLVTGSVVGSIIAQGVANLLLLGWVMLA